MQSLCASRFLSFCARLASASRFSFATSRESSTFARLFCNRLGLEPVGLRAERGGAERQFPETLSSSARSSALAHPLTKPHDRLARAETCARKQPSEKRRRRFDLFGATARLVSTLEPFLSLSYCARTIVQVRMRGSAAEDEAGSGSFVLRRSTLERVPLPAFLNTASRHGQG